MTDTATVFEAPNETGGSLVCDDCGKTCRSRRGLDIHVSMKHGGKTLSEASSGAAAGPKRMAAPKAPRAAKRASEGQLRDAATAWVQMFYGMGGGILAQVTPEWGGAVMACSNEQMVNAWIGLAHRHKSIHDLLVSGEAVTVYAMFVAAHQPILQMAQTRVMAGMFEPPPDDPMAHPAPGSPAEEAGEEWPLDAPWPDEAA